MPQPDSPDRFKRLAEIQQRIDVDRAARIAQHASKLSEPKKLGDLLHAFIVERGLNRMLSAQGFDKAILEVIGPKKFSMIRVGQMRRGVLNISVANSCLLDELRNFQKPAMIKALKAGGAASTLYDIRFRVAAITDEDTTVAHGEKS